MGKLLDYVMKQREKRDRKLSRLTKNNQPECFGLFHSPQNDIEWGCEDCKYAGKCYEEWEEKRK
jgi:hypothetical protein